MIQTIYLKETPFLNIYNNLKTIEIRQYKGFIKTLQQNTQVYFNFNDNKILVTITEIIKYNNLLELLNNTQLELINPNLKTIEDTRTYFKTYYNSFNLPFVSIRFIRN